MGVGVGLTSPEEHPPCVTVRREPARFDGVDGCGRGDCGGGRGGRGRRGGGKGGGKRGETEVCAGDEVEGVGWVGRGPDEGVEAVFGEGGKEMRELEGSGAGHGEVKGGMESGEGTLVGSGWGIG